MTENSTQLSRELTRRDLLKGTAATAAGLALGAALPTLAASAATNAKAVSRLAKTKPAKEVYSGASIPRGPRPSRRR